MISFPRPGHYSKREYRLQLHQTYNDRVYSWLVSVALRRLLMIGQRVGADLPDADTLADHVEGQAYIHGWDRIKSPYDVQRSRAGRRDGWITTTQLAEMCARAAAYALDAYRPDYLAKAIEGGRKSRRGPTFTVEQLAAVDGLSIAQQAAALGCSTSTIESLRREMKRRAADQGPTFEDLLADLG